MGSIFVESILLILFSGMVLWVNAILHIPNNTILLISLDGYRYDFHKIANTPNLNRLRAEGVHAERLIPVYPVKTWPNQQSIVTGLYPESHGIVSNRFWDPIFETKFKIDDKSTEFEPRFWDAAEPIWLTNEKMGGRSALYHWPGYKSYKIKPTYYIENVIYNTSRLSGCMDRIDKIMSWLESGKPPNFIALYHDHPDWEGHEFGPNSTQYIQELEDVDKNCVGYCIDELKKRNILDQINLVIVGDHGFVTVAKNNTLLLDQYIDLKSCNITERFPAVHIWPKVDQIYEMYHNLTKAPGNNKTFRVYLKKDIPVRYHWRNNRRIPPILIQMEPGYFFVDNKALMKYFYIGAHAYDPQVKDVGTIFIAHGPAFKQNITIKPFENIHVYPLLAHILGLPEMANNGSLKFVAQCLKKNPFTTPQPSTISSKPVTAPSIAVPLEIFVTKIQLAFIGIYISCLMLEIVLKQLQH